MRRTQLLAAVCLFAAPLAPAAAQDDLTAAVAADYEANLEELFLHFHANPELSFQEHATAARLAQELRDLGYEVTEGVGGTGLVSVLENGDGPTVLIRADMDGLPVEELSGLPYASTARQPDIDGIERPVMHACGHDVHITSLIGTARQLMARREDWSGTLVLIAQPAEERGGGAHAMIEDGLYERFPQPDYAVAFHVSSQSEAGKIQISGGLVYSSVDSVDITVRGVGTHGASPHKGLDPVLIASEIVVALQTVVSRSIDPLQPGVITVGSIHGGSVHNVISDHVDMQLTVRANDLEVREQLLDGIDRVSENVARAMGVPDDLLPIVTRREIRTPATFNDDEAAARVEAAFINAFGEDRLTYQPREGMGGEDFAYLAAPEQPEVKGVYFSVGGTPAENLETAPAHHSALFQIVPEPAVTTGVEATVVAALELFRSEE
ncbi:MAG: amidohydrolase [Maricaulaceae bacterium]